MIKPALIAIAIGASLASQAATIREDSPKTGTKIRKDIAWTAIQLNLPYAQLDDKARAIVAARYENLGPQDEPPFPLAGEGPLLKALAEAAKQTQVADELDLVADIGADGKVTNVKLMAPFLNDQYAKYAAKLLYDTTFKPGLCKGTPCAMPYPYKVNFVRR